MLHPLPKDVVPLRRPGSEHLLVIATPDHQRTALPGTRPQDDIRTPRPERPRLGGMARLWQVGDVCSGLTLMIVGATSPLTTPQPMTAPFSTCTPAGAPTASSPGTIVHAVESPTSRIRATSSMARRKARSLQAVELRFGGPGQGSLVLRVARPGCQRGLLVQVDRHRGEGEARGDQAAAQHQAGPAPGGERLLCRMGFSKR